jgi:pyruvate/2-oxoglutarate dehydrogenase complex dihydrolipoamide acyltransferase (E2) component
VPLEFRLPDIGEGLAEAEVVEWLVSPGERVTEDQPVLVVETDKASVEVPAPAAGRILERRAEAGDRVKVGAVLYLLEIDQPQVAPPTGPGPVAPPPQPASQVPVPAAAAGVAPLATPAVRKLVRELGVDLAAVSGSGPGGRVTAEDLERHHAGPPAERDIETVAPPMALQPAAGDRRVPLRGVQRRMAEAMALSARTIPHVTGFHEIDSGALLAAHRRLAAAAAEKGGRMPFDALLVRACAIALRSFPIFNTSLDEVAGEVVFHQRINIGVAAATPQGLLVPVVHDADRLDLEQLAAEVDRLATEARAGTLAVADLQGGTFTISNTGAWQSGFNTSLIRHPEAAIVGFGRAQDRAVVRDGRVVIRPILPLAITFDHRLIDGQQGLGFAAALRELLEGPEPLLLGS